VTCTVLYVQCKPTRLRLKCDGTRAETRFRLSAKRTSPFKSAGTSVQLNTDTRGVRISGSSAGYTMFRGSVKGTGYPLHSPVSPSLPLPCVTVCHHISTGLYSHAKFVLKKATPLLGFLQALKSFPVSITAPTSPTFLHLNTNLMRRTSGQNLETFK